MSILGVAKSSESVRYKLELTNQAIDNSDIVQLLNLLNDEELIEHFNRQTAHVLHKQALSARRVTFSEDVEGLVGSKKRRASKDLDNNRDESASNTRTLGIKI